MRVLGRDRLHQGPRVTFLATIPPLTSGPWPPCPWALAGLAGPAGPQRQLRGVRAVANAAGLGTDHSPANQASVAENLGQCLQRLCPGYVC